LSSTPITPDPATLPRYPPLEHFFEPGDANSASSRRASLTVSRFLSRANRDQQLRLAVALAIPVLVMEGMSDGGSRAAAAVLALVYVAVQLGLATIRTAPTWLTGARLTLSLAFVLVANVIIGPDQTFPLSALVIPIAAVAASLGGRALIVAGATVVAALIPLALPGSDAEVRREAVAIAMVALVIANGSRHVVRTLEQSADRIRNANTRDRRRARQLGAVEQVGRVLAREGSTMAALDQVMELVEETFGYRYPSVYLWDGSMLRLGAQRNYRYPILELPGDRGVIGRVVRSQQPEFLPDTRNDPDFMSGDPDIASEIAVPLMSEDELFGILNVETDAAHRLDEDDFATMLIVGDRLAAAIALGRERQKLTERAALLDRLSTFEASLNASLEPATVHQQVVTGAALVVPADMLILVLRAADSDEYRTIAIDGGDERVLGARILPGEGITGRALSTRALVVDDHLERMNFPRSTSKARIADVLAAMSAPLIHDDEVVGAMSWFREDTNRTFTPQEQEVAGLLANRVALAVMNATLHEEARSAAITDALSGLHNRRHFDAAMAHADALRSRLAVEDRRERSAILFDLDHFGAINKRHGHQIGDQILRSFADVLRSRVRASDLVARYGGEEFVVILDGASRDEAVRLADEVRIAFRQESIDASDSGLPITTVSAGCASLDKTETSGSTLLERADVGLAMAKAAGRDQVVAA
jgi:diguanylate cyclase (GGDEF)-like protein